VVGESSALALGFVQAVSVVGVLSVYDGSCWLMPPGLAAAAVCSSSTGSGTGRCGVRVVRSWVCCVWAVSLVGVLSVYLEEEEV
jgi:hypothetical protein